MTLNRRFWVFFVFVVFIFTNPLTAYSEVIIYYSFDDGTIYEQNKVINRAPFSSPIGDGTIIDTGSGFPKSEGGTVGQSLDFGGVDALVNTHYKMKGDTTWAVSYWTFNNDPFHFKNTSGADDGSQDIVHFWKDLPQVKWNSSEFDQIYTPYSDGWNHHALSFDGDHVTMYLNGNVIGSEPLSPVTISVPFGVGSKNGRDNNQWPGKIDEFFMFDDSITQTQVNNLNSSDYSNLTLVNNSRLRADFDLSNISGGQNGVFNPDRLSDCYGGGETIPYNFNVRSARADTFERYVSLISGNPNAGIDDLFLSIVNDTTVTTASPDVSGTIQAPNKDINSARFLFNMIRKDPQETGRVVYSRPFQVDTKSPICSRPVRDTSGAGRSEVDDLPGTVFGSPDTSPPGLRFETENNRGSGGTRFEVD